MTIATQTEFWAAFHAIDRLNSWIRCKENTGPLGFCGKYPIKDIVYWCKTKAILQASRLVHCRFRRVKVVTKCRLCGGTGVFHHWWAWPDKGEKCRKCVNGKAFLLFVESNILNIRWHTPQREWWSCSNEVYVPFAAPFEVHGYEDADDWKPNQVGRSMPFEDVLRDIRLLRRGMEREFDFILDFRCFNSRHRYGLSNSEFEQWIGTLKPHE